jgi:hypothetical protein
MQSKPTITDLAARWRCSERTIYRLVGAGVDPEDPVAVARYLAEVRAPSASMVEAVLSALDELSESP